MAMLLRIEQIVHSRQDRTGTETGTAILTGQLQRQAALLSSFTMLMSYPTSSMYTTPGQRQDLQTQPQDSVRMELERPGG